MFKNYLNVALRALKHQRLYAAINVLGLAVGLACAILIFLFVREELTYDNFHSQKERIFRMARVSFTETGDPEDYDVYLPYPMTPALVEEIPEVASVVQLTEWSSFMQLEGTTYEENTLFAGEDFFTTFSFPLIQGNPKTALSKPGDLVLTERLARKIFGSEWQEAVGKEIEVRLADDYEVMQVSAIAENPPTNSTIQFEYVLPFEQIFVSYPDFEADKEDWGSSWIITYVLLEENASPVAFQEKLPGFYQDHYPNTLTNYQEQRGWESDLWPTSYHAQAQADIHWNYNIQGGITESSNPAYSYNLGYMAAALLLIAMINFMTLAIGRSAKRGKEVAMRKVIGAQRRQVMGQFWVESILLAFLSLLLGILFAGLLLPTFNNFADKALTLADLFQPINIAFLLFITLFTGFVAGSYPALVLSNFKPLDIFRNRMQLGGSNLFTRGLVVAQFTISSALLLGTFIISEQLSFMRNKDLGYNDEQVVVLPNRTFGNQRVLEHFQNRLGSESSILEITGVMTSFGRGNATTGWLYEDELYSAKVFPCTPNYVQTLGLELVEGRNFDLQLATDSSKAIVNEAFLAMFNWDYGVGRNIPGLERIRANLSEPEIIGVLKDYQYQSLENTVEPLVIYFGSTDRLRQVLVKITPNNMAETIEKMESAWSEITDDVPFEYSFLNEDMDRLYSADERWGRIIGSVASLTIFVACLGLFGLAALTVRGRVRELGIRKILGANGWHLSWVILRTLTLLICIGLLIGIPIAGFVMKGWLQDFAFRVILPVWIYSLPVVVLVGVALLTLAFHLLRAQRLNPVESLRAE
ncbi:MAG TPA: hypothetical protein DCE41_24960 [Cytophagales bacterium]|nr:hypothetical protein [Cytophagales bacterium]HAA23214.1 hypothetical protein [Cytophagales bacterium]HAP58498.1 hypothetical protein [Cytophagales bacterium]